MGNDCHMPGFLPTQHQVQVLSGGLPVEACGAFATEQGGESVEWELGG